MFTSGSKYFIGLTAISAVAVGVYAFLINPQDLGSVALLGLLSGFATLAGFSLFTRDNETADAKEAAEAASPAPGRSLWPMVFALGLALVLVGVATVPVVFILGIGVLVAGCVEWAVQNWADRASAEESFNETVRHRIIGGLEYPGISALVAGVVVYLFSRVMLNASKDGASIIFIIVSALIMALGFLFALKPGMRGKVMGLVVSLGAVALIAAGVFGALAGERQELAEAYAEDHFSAEHRECGPEKSKYFDKNPNNGVGIKSAILATVMVEDGKVGARMIGLDQMVDTITIPRSNPTSILFRNFDDKDYRMVIHLGERPVGDTGAVEKMQDCTQLTGKDRENILTVTIAKPAAGEPYKITVPGASGEIKVVVP